MLFERVVYIEAFGNNTVGLFVLCIVSLYGHYRDVSDSDNTVDETIKESGS